MQQLLTNPVLYIGLAAGFALAVTLFLVFLAMIGLADERATATPRPPRTGPRTWPMCSAWDGENHVARSPR